MPVSQRWLLDPLRRWRKLQALEEKKKQMEEEMSKKAEHSTQEERQLLIDMHEKKLGQMEQVCGWLPCGC